MGSAVPEVVSETKRDDRLIRSIFEHAARISREQQIDELVRLNADFARDLAGADRCSLWLIDETTHEIWTKVAHGVASIRIPWGQGLVGACILEDKVLLVNDAEHEPRLLRTVDEGTGYHTRQVLCVPLRAEGQIIGAFQLLNKPSGFTEVDAGLLGLLAHFAASAIDNERLRQEAERSRLTMHELFLAREVQARLLPECPKGVSGLECVGFCRPARTIGGDYYDLLELKDGQFALTLGDVSGKGIPAAVMMASIQTLLRSLLQGCSKTLDEVVADLNQTLYGSSTPERYSTLFCGVISADRKVLTYVNAGHVPPLLLHAEGLLERLSGGDLPVGILPEVGYEQLSIALTPGDTLLVVSDGVVEVRNSEEDFWDEEEIDHVLLTHRETPLPELPALFCSAADKFAGSSEQYDDMTIVAVRID
jgi:sigma-B regulation protein RsbU (phosphoserine phosphatase)